jgi:putative IMPACT (imprinted ancient) family translation regulator
MLNVFVREGVTDFCCVVTRYFGGILLGTGGLSRAYAKAAKDALLAAGTCVVEAQTLWDIPCPYPLLEAVKREISACGGQVEHVDYGERAMVCAAFRNGGEGDFSRRLRELSAGEMVMNFKEEVFRAGQREN